MTYHEWQIPRSGEVEGCTLFQGGRVLPVHRMVLSHCGITAKNGLSCGGGLIAASRRVARRVNSFLLCCFRTHTVRPSGQLSLRALLGRAAPRRGHKVGRGVSPSRFLPTTPSIHPHRRACAGAFHMYPTLFPCRKCQRAHIWRGDRCGF